jgi:hypothetical protein
MWADFKTEEVRMYLFLATNGLVPNCRELASVTACSCPQKGLKRCQVSWLLAVMEGRSFCVGGH